MPRLMVRFLESLLQNRRQLLIPVIASEYATLVDESLGRVRAEVTLAREPEPGEVEAIAASLSKTLGRYRGRARAGEPRHHRRRDRARR